MEEKLGAIKDAWFWQGTNGFIYLTVQTRFSEEHVTLSYSDCLAFAWSFHAFDNLPKDKIDKAAFMKAYVTDCIPELEA